MGLIIVEGIPGSGKSSLARFISLQTERNGKRTELFHESTYPHPILLEDGIRNPVEWQNAYFSRWNNFLTEQADNNTVVVMESVLFQSPILHLLHMDIDRDEIIHFIGKLFSLLASVNCSLIYLFQNEPSVGIQRMMAARGGESWLHNTYEKYKQKPYYVNRGQKGKELHLTFLHEYATLAKRAFSLCNIHSLAVDNSHWNWTSDYSIVLEFLKLTHYPDPILSPIDLGKFVGQFRNEGTGMDIQIELVGQELVVFGNQRLKPRSESAFYLENISMSFSFINDPSGKPNQVIIYEKDLVGNRNDEGTPFVRIL